MAGNQLLHITTLLKRLGIVLALFTLCRIIFFLFNAHLFPDVTIPRFFLMLGLGLRYDIAAILIINSIFILLHIIPNPWRERKPYQAALKVLFYTFNGIALILEAGDFIYYEFAQQRTSSHILGLAGDIPRLIPQFIKDFWYVLIILVPIIVGVEWAYRKASRALKGQVGKQNLVIQASLVPLLLLLGVIALSGFRFKMISPVQAAQNVHIEEISLVTNTTYTCIYSMTHRELSEANYFPKEQLNTHFKIHHNMRQGSLGDSTLLERPNVVVLIMESFSKEYVGRYNNGSGFTPNLDSLSEQSLRFERAFANGKHSIDALSSISLGLPALMNDSYISSRYVNNDIAGLGDLLRPLGYKTFFFHGGHKGTMRFDKFAEKAGFDEYFGMEQYGNDEHFDGNWGIYDEPFLQFMNDKLTQTREPFCSVFFSLSSHHPFTIPEKHADRFPETEFPMEAPVRYADYALGQFFKKASAQEWYSNTLFIVTADHTGPMLREASKNRLGHYAIPLLLYSPGGALIGSSDRVVQHADILPTILDAAGFEGDYTSFGSTVLQDAEFEYAINQMNDIYQIVWTDYVMHFDGEEPLALYNYKEDPTLERNVLGQHPTVGEMLENKLKAIIQQFRHALRNNELVPS